MTPCPPTERLHDLLDDRLDPQALAAVVEHVEGCPDCQRRLERLTDRSDPPAGDPDATTDLPASAGPPGGTEVWPASDGPEATQAEPDRPPSAGPSSATDVDAGPAGTVEYPRSGDAATGEFTPTSCPGRGERGPDAPPEVPGYDLGERLGEGGMGVVYRARHRRLGREVALKMIRGGGLARAEHLARFQTEAEAVARLRHPDVVQIYDVGEAGGWPYVALELLEGGSLASRLDGTPWNGRDAAALVARLARAVASAHAAGVIHRDLKPANILYSAAGEPKVADFGLAKRLGADDGHTETGQVLGTPSYMAPEQAAGRTREVGPATDVYALGAILYQFVTGRPPFKGESAVETVRMVVDADVVPPSRLVPRVPRDLETVCLVCLNKDPARRYPSAAALADDLDRFVRGETVRARRAGRLERALKWARRRPAAAALVALAAAAGAGLLAGAAVYARELNLRQQRALQLIADGDRRIDRARDLADPEALAQAKLDLSKFLVGLENQPLTGDLAGRVRGAVEGVERKLREARDREARRERDRADRQRHQAFLGLRARVHLAGAEFELNPADRAARLGAAARELLAVYAADPRAPDRVWSLADPLPSALTEAERRGVRDACFDALLALSQAVEPAAGLEVLAAAERLRPEPSAALHLRRAEYLGRLGDRAGRGREEELAAGVEPATALDHFLLGREHLGRRRWDDAAAALEAALAREPGLTSAHVLLAVARFNARPPRLGEAIGSLNDALRDHPDLVELYLLRALAHGERANQSLRRTAAAEPGQAGPLRAQAAVDFEAAAADYRTALARDPDRRLRYVLLVNRGGMLLQAGRPAEAEADLEAAVALDPAPYQAHANLAQLRQRQDRVEDASAAFGRAIERAADPATRAALHRSRARLLAGDRAATPAQRDLALADLADALRSDPGDPRGRADDQAVRAQLLFAAGRYEDTLSACDEALRLQPDHPAALRRRISALTALRRFGAVLAACDAYLETQEPTAEVLELRGLARVARRDYRGAIADDTHALELRPEPPAALRVRLLNHRGWCHHFADAPRLALADFETSLALAPDQPDALAGRGLARVRLGSWREAVSDAEAAVRRASSATASSATAAGPTAPEPRTHFNAARIYAQAVPHAAAEVSRRGEDAIRQYRSYRDRAVTLLNLALRSTPEPDRATMLRDPALEPLRLPRPRPAPDASTPVR